MVEKAPEDREVGVSPAGETLLGAMVEQLCESYYAMQGLERGRRRRRPGAAGDQFLDDVVAGVAGAGAGVSSARTNAPIPNCASAAVAMPTTVRVRGGGCDESGRHVVISFADPSSPVPWSCGSAVDGGTCSSVAPARAAAPAAGPTRSSHSTGRASLASARRCPPVSAPPSPLVWLWRPGKAPVDRRRAVLPTHPRPPWSIGACGSAGGSAGCLGRLDADPA